MAEKNRKAYEFLNIPQRPSKPRDEGITMLIDWGTPLKLLQDELEVYGPFVDIAKVAVGISGLMDRKFLQEKIAIYKKNSIMPFPGGMFLELASLRGQADEYMEETAALGYPLVEVSDNFIDMPAEKRRELFKLAQKHGLKILGEVGKKTEFSTADSLVEDVQVNLEAGAWKVLVEAKELFGDELDIAKVDALGKKVSLKDVIFEIPATWIHGVKHYTQHEIFLELLSSFGANVNLANVEREDIVQLETLRVGVGVDTSMDFGAYNAAMKKAGVR